jgi:predicted Zn-dependent peptidase
MMQLTVLPNGLRVASRNMRSVETVAVGLYADTGSRYEPAELNGIAHLFEHMVFKGAGGRSARELSEVIEDVGGDLNASTDREGTAFYASLLAADLALGVEVIADLIRRPHFESHHLANEKKVVGQELAEARDNATDIIFDHLQAAAFPNQPFGRSVLGDDRSLERIGVDDLHVWRDVHYRPDRLILVGAGKLHHDQLVELGDRHFGDMEPAAAITPEPARFVGGWHFERRRSRQAHVSIGMESPSWSDSAAYAAQLFADAVGVGTSSRLFQRMREDLALAYTVSSAAQAYSDTGLFSVYLATDRGDAQWAQEQVERELARAVGTMSEAELARAKALAKAAMMMNLESCWGQASYMATRLQRDRRLVDPAEIVARLDAVSLDEVCGAGERMLAGPRALASVGGKLAKAA